MESTQAFTFYTVQTVVEQYKRRALVAWGTDEPPDVAVILGSGLDLGSVLQDQHIWRFNEFTALASKSDLPGHANKLVFGRIGDKRVLVFCGRRHFYQGYDDAEVMILARSVSLPMWRAKLLIITNAAGALNRDFRPGDVMAITGIMALFANVNMCFGPHDPRLGEQFFDISRSFRRRLIRDLVQSAYNKVNGIPNGTFVLRRGVYVMRPGPFYESRPDAEALRILGGDAVGMSTASDVVGARQSGHQNMIGLSIITNFSGGVGQDDDEDDDAGHKEVVAQAEASGPYVAQLISHIATDLRDMHLKLPPHIAA